MASANPPAQTGPDRAAAPFDPARPYRLDDDVALRPERFGALAYSYGTRRLTFLRSTLLADVVRSLGEHPSVDDALAASVPAPQQPTYRAALASLAQSGFLRAC